MKLGPIEFSLRRTPKIVTAKPGQPETFLLGVKKYRARPGHKVWYSHSNRTGDVSVPVKKVPLDDTLEVAEDVEAFIESRWGGGDWKVEILDSDNRILCTYKKQVPGPTYNTKTGRKRDPRDPPEDGSGGTRRGSLAAEIENLGKIATVMQTLQGGSGPSPMENLAERMMSATFDNSITREENRLQDLKTQIEIANMLRPNVAAEDPWTSVLTSLAPPVMNALMMRGGGSPALQAGRPGVSALPVGGNDGHDMNALRNAALSLPPAIIGSLPPEQQAAVIRLRDSAPSYGQGSAVLPRPGASSPGLQPSAEPGGGAGLVGDAAAPSPSPHHGAIDGMIMDIRRELASGAPDPKVAGKMMALMTFARRFTADRPHPALAGLMAATDETGDQEFVRLCNQIPELQGDEAHIKNLGREILSQMKAGAKETSESLEDVPTEGSAPDTGNYSGPQFEYETEAERMAAVKAEGVTNDEDVSGPAGLPGITEPERGGEPARDEDPADSEQIRQTA